MDQLFVVVVVVTFDFFGISLVRTAPWYGLPQAVYSTTTMFNAMVLLS